MTYANEDSPEVPKRPCIDWSMLDGMAALGKPGAPDLRIRLLETFLSASPPLMKELRAAVAGSDATAIAKAAHSLKSSSLNMGAKALGSLCAQLERLGREKDLREAADILTRADNEFMLVVDDFDCLLKKLRSPAS